MKLASGIALILSFSLLFQNSEDRISRMNIPAISAPVHEVVPIIINFSDTLQNDTLLIYYDRERTPVKYSRRVICNVCVKQECRLVNIELFWNITGRYLGFMLPEGEFLTKNIHEHFSVKDYDQLHSILNNPLSPLAKYSINDLVSLSNLKTKNIDAVSSATNLSISNYVVKGAVYTTYTLWQIVYGDTKKEIEKQTAKMLTSEIAVKILSEDNSEDIKWVLNHIPSDMKISTVFTKKIFNLIAGDDLYLTKTALNALSNDLLTDEIQLKLFEIFKNSGYLKQRLILEKLSHASHLNREIVYGLADNFETLTGTEIIDIIRLFKTHNIDDKQIIRQIAALLENDNKYVANEAWNFLNEVKIADNKTLRKIRKYKK